MSQFTRAVKAQLKGRVALCGPTGSGKTWTALEWAEVLAGDTGRIAFVDTERGSAALYADRFEFDTLDWAPPYEPAKLVATLKAAAADGYDVIVVDSLTHFWSGEGGTLDVVDAAAQRAHGNTFAGWKVGSPAQREMVDTLVGIPCHVIVTMRSKMEYVLETDSRGKQVPRKVGMAPEQRAGVEYEFTLVGDLDLEHRLVITKSRCDQLADAVMQPGHAAEGAKQFASWLESGEPMATSDDRARIRAALLALDAEPRAEIAMQLRDRFGPAEQMRATQVEDALAAIELFAEPRGAAVPTAAAVSGGERAGGPESAPSGGNAPGPSATPNLSGAVHQPGEESVGFAGSSPAPPPAPLAVGGEVDAPISAGQVAANQPPATSPPAAPLDDAARVAIWCADAGIMDDLRPAFLHACCGVTSAHDVPAESLGALRETLDEIRAGRLELVVDPDGGSAPWLREVGSTEVRQTDEPAPAEVTWRALLGQVRGIGQKKLLDQARALAGERGIDLPCSIDEIPSGLNADLRSWLDEQQTVRT